MNTNLLVSLLLLFASFAPHAAPTNKELRLGITQEFENMNPIVMQMLASTYIYAMVGRTLTVLDENTQWVPQLAKTIPTIENGMARFIKRGDDELIEAKWEVKKQAKWGDGTPVTCEDIKFSWEVALSKNITISSREPYEDIKEIQIDAKNPKKCTLIVARKWNFSRNVISIIPKHIEKPVFEKYKNEKSGYEKNSNYNTNPTLPGLYNGPYRVKDIKLGSHITLVRNKHFYGGKAPIQKIILKLIPNTGTLEANLRSGTIDMISVLGMSFDQALAFEKKIKKEKLPFQVNFKQSLVYEHIDLNLRNPILKDLDVRRALVYAINRDELTKALFDGRQKPAIHGRTPIDPWYSGNPKEVVLYPYSRRKAKKLLDKAGWKVNKDGFRYKDGKKLKFQLMTTAGNKVRELVQVFLKDQWKQIGIDISIKNEPARVFFGETVRKAKYPAMAMYAWISTPESNVRSTLHSEQIPTEKNNYSGQNSGGYSNKEADTLIEQLDVEFSAGKRREIAVKLLYHYTNDVPVIPLYYRSDVSVTPPNMTGYKIPGHNMSASNHVEKWSFK